MTSKIRFWSVVVLACLFSFLAVGVATYAQEERITLTTYYPSPMGIYRTLRLVPHAACGPGNACQPGDMCLSSVMNILYICDTGGVWRMMSNLWAISPTDINSIYSLAPSNVGIGTNAPVSKLDVRGNTNICVRRAYGIATGNGLRCPAGFVSAIYMGGAAPTSGFFLCCRSCGVPDWNNNGICDD